MKIQSTKSMGTNCLKFLIFGESGAGKTSLARTIQEPVLVISAEAGLLSLKDSNVDYIDICSDDEGKLIPKEKRIDRLQKVYQYLLTKECQEKYQWIFVDSLTEIGQNLVEQLQSEIIDRKDSLVLWGEYSKKMRSLIKAFRDLPYYHVVLTALAAIDKDDQQNRFLGIDLNGKISSQCAAYFDEVFYLGISKDSDGNIKRFLLTQKNDRILAKDRSGKLTQFEECDLHKIKLKINEQAKEKKK